MQPSRKAPIIKIEEALNFQVKLKTKDFNRCICFISKICVHQVMKSLCCVMSCALVNEAVLKPTSKTKCKLKSKNHFTVKTLAAPAVRLQRKAK